MDGDKPAFILDLDEPTPNVKPLPPSIKKRKIKSFPLLDHYPNFDGEFFNTIKSCGEYIDKIKDAKDKKRFNDDLSNIFMIRNKFSALRLFKELWDYNIKGR